MMSVDPFVGTKDGSPYLSTMVNVSTSAAPDTGPEKRRCPEERIIGLLILIVIIVFCFWFDDPLILTVSFSFFSVTSSFSCS